MSQCNKIASIDMHRYERKIKRKIILLSSKDHGKTWKYIDTLIDCNDAKNSGYLTYTAKWTTAF